MFWTCSVWNCESNQSSIISGRHMKLYPYPNDKKLQEIWKTVCKSVSYFENNFLFRLCELHFEKKYIKKDLTLRRDAVPSIFDSPNKRKSETTPKSKSKEPPTKKLKENRVNLPTKGIKTQKESTPSKSKSKESPTKKFKENGANLPSKTIKTQNQKKPQETMVYSRSFKNSTKTPDNTRNPVRYRLTIDIERIIPDPIQDDSESADESQSSIEESLSDASQKRKRKSETNSPEKSEIKIKVENFLDRNSTTEESDNESDNLRFSDQNETNFDGFSPVSDSHKKEEIEMEAEYLTYSDQDETNISPPLNDFPEVKEYKEEEYEEEEEKEEKVKAEYLLSPVKKETNGYYQESSPTKLKNPWYNPNDKRCRNGCALEKITYDSNVSFRCLNCKISYNVINKSTEEILNTSYESDKQKLTNGTNRIKLARTQKSMRILSEYLIFTPNVNIHLCKGKCELKDIIWNNDDSYICKNCNNIYKKSIRFAVRLPLLDEDILLNDESNDLLSDDDLVISDDESSNFWDNSSSDPEAENDECLKKKNPKLVMDIPESSESSAGCKNTCHLTEENWLGKTSLKCPKCWKIFKFKNEDDAKNFLEVNRNLRKSKVKNKNAQMLNKSRMARDMLKTLNDKSKEIDNLLETLKKSDKGNDVSKTTPNLQSNNQTVPVNKPKTVDNLPKTTNDNSKRNHPFKFDNTLGKLSEFLKIPKEPKKPTTAVNDNIVKKINEIKLSEFLKIPKEPKKPTTVVNDNIVKTIDEIKTLNVSNRGNEVIDSRKKCGICGKGFPTIDLLANHFKDHNCCDICYMSFKSSFKLETHYSIHQCSTSPKRFQCHICDLIFNTKELLKIHLPTAHDIKPEVQLANDLAENIQKLPTVKGLSTMHVDLTTETPENSASTVPEPLTIKFSCNICQMEFITLKEIKEHTYTHLDGATKELKCNICQQTFQDNYLFQNHLREHIANSYRCPQCPKAFIDELSLQTHILSHEVYYIVQQ